MPRNKKSKSKSKKTPAAASASGPAAVSYTPGVPVTVRWNGYSDYIRSKILDLVEAERNKMIYCSFGPEGPLIQEIENNSKHGDYVPAWEESPSSPNEMMMYALRKPFWLRVPGDPGKLILMGPDPDAKKPKDLTEFGVYNYIPAGNQSSDAARNGK